MREIVQAFGIPPSPFATPVTERKNLSISSMTRYKGDFPFPVLFEAQSMDNVLAEWLAKKSIPQYHVAGACNDVDCRIYFYSHPNADYC